MESLAKAAAGEDPEVSQPVEKFLERFPATRIPSLYQLLRVRLPWRYMEPDRVEGSWSTLALLSLHPNGYVREAAVRGLRLRPGAGAVGFLVWRLNDWVPEIRTVARASLDEMLVPRFALGFVASLPLLRRLMASRRGTHSSFVRHVHQFLKTPECRDALREGRTLDDWRVRDAAFRLDFEASGELPIVDLALRDASPRIRLWAAQRLRRMERCADWDRLLKFAQTDAWPMVRADALLTGQRMANEAGLSACVHALWDTSAVVRRKAGSLLKQSGRDPAELYRASMGEGPPRKVAAGLLGLGEWGGQVDASEVRPYARAERPSIRWAAIRALSSLGAEEDLEAIVAALADPSPRVAREAGRTLLRYRAQASRWSETILQHLKARPELFAQDVTAWGAETPA